MGVVISSTFPEKAAVACKGAPFSSGVMQKGMATGLHRLQTLNSYLEPENEQSFAPGALALSSFGGPPRDLHMEQLVQM